LLHFLKIDETKNTLKKY